jgi:spermidine/putrescine transport system substrate-binding protein
MGASTGFDLVVLSDWMVAQLIDLGWAEGISPDGVPNAANLLPELQATPLADVGSHSLPWQAGGGGAGRTGAEPGGAGRQGRSRAISQ